MKFDCHLLKNKPSLPLSFQETLTMPSAYGLINDQVQVCFEGSVTAKEPDFYCLEGLLSATLPCSCDRCLERVDIPLQLDVCESFRKKEEDVPTGGQPEKKSGQEDFFNFEGGSIDFSPALAVLIGLNIPLRVLCREDCKGLCTICGHDLNQGDCGCDRTIKDSRFDVLRSFFKDKEVE